MSGLFKSDEAGTTAIPNIPDEKMREALKELEQATYNHDRWAESLYGTLICRLSPDRNDLRGDAWRLCRFGQWYYGSGAASFDGHPGFAAIGTEHQLMHQYAANLLGAASGGTQASIDDYERFVTALKRLRLEIATIRHELEDALNNRDPLTGTPSRIGMLTKLREQHELAKRKMQTCAIAMLDLDHFKQINDKYGHAAGDKVLIAVAQDIMARLRPYDKVFRYGGEEFLIVFPATDLTEARGIVERLHEEIGSLRHYSNRNEEFHVTVSIGLTLLDPDLPVQESIDRADKALYAAKAAGRNRSTIWDTSMDALAKAISQ